MLSNINVAIVGAGVVGLTAASELLEKGMSITLFEKSNTISVQSSSWQAGGMISAFCESESSNDRLETFGQLAINWWLCHVPETIRSGTGTLVLTLSRDYEELNRFARRTHSYKWLNVDGIASLEPDLSERFSRGLFFYKEAFLNPRKTLVLLAEKIKQRGGFLHLGEEVNPQDLISEKKFDVIIDARGFFCTPEIPSLRGVRGEMIIIRCPDVFLSHPIRLLHPRSSIYVIPREDNYFMVGASMIESNHQNPITLRSAVELMNTAYALHPAFAEADIIELGVGIRPSFPNNMPKILENGKIFIINGMYRYGFLMAPILAMELSKRLKVQFYEGK
ncbi:LOW QUALITY PROTEIN: Glycine oxidase ThiO [Liberibacter crescens BT-1]|uniref:D-amino-acid oxidase n=2 Tax=Liberibacter crescens TaxID=1273132 RepID=L0ETX9_LIBCB|nr:LOW QUALITY PROTEIN: Glycine oxidase ThiO [Liberibacter crescens BT-1]